MRKLYHVIDTPNGPSKDFQRHAYQLPDNKDITVVHYLGDENVASNFPHRNAKHSTTMYVRTCPSYLKSLEKKCEMTRASVVYKKEVAQPSCQPEHVPVCIPRNMQQLRTIRHKQLNHQHISSDELYNLHELAYDIPGFVHKINTFPDLTCVCGLKELLDEADKVLMLNETQQLLSYDTTFQLGNFYDLHYYFATHYSKNDHAFLPFSSSMSASSLKPTSYSFRKQVYTSHPLKNPRLVW